MDMMGGIYSFKRYVAIFIPIIKIRYVFSSSSSGAISPFMISHVINPINVITVTDIDFLSGVYSSCGCSIDNNQHIAIHNAELNTCKKDAINKT